MDERQKVLVTEFNKSFWRKVWFTIKREVKAIPAALILIIAGFALMSILGSIILNR
jgi:hypothetical protein